MGQTRVRSMEGARRHNVSGAEAAVAMESYVGWAMRCVVPAVVALLASGLSPCGRTPLCEV